MYLSLGPWQQRTNRGLTYWGRPDGSLGAVDLRGGGRNVALIVSLQPLGAGVDVTLNAMGDHPRDLPLNGAIRSAIASLTGYLPPDGLTLADALLDLLRHGDPQGTDRWAPLLPIAYRRQRLVLPGYGLVAQAPFRWGVDQDTSAIQARVRRDVKQRLDEVEQGRARREAVQRIVGGLQRKYRMDDWHQFVGVEDRGRLGGPLRPATTYTDSFNRTAGGLDGSTASGGGLWELVEGSDWSTNGTQLLSPGVATEESVRLESDVSSDDHYTEIDVVSNSGPGSVGECGRFAAAAITFYHYQHNNDGSVGKIWKRVNTSTWTDLADCTLFTTGTFRLTVDGSNLTAARNGSTTGSITDTEITGNTRGGLYSFFQNDTMDNFTFADNSAPSGGSLILGKLLRC